MVVSLLVIVGLSGLTWLHASAFGDAYSLWTSTLAVNPDSWLANFSLASELALEARNDDAIGQADTASDKRKRAIDYYNTSLELRPHQYSGHNNLGFIYLDLGRFDDAEREFRLAIAESSDPAGKPPDYIEPFGPYLNLGIVLDHRKDYAQAIPVLQKASALVDTPEPRTGEFPEPRARALVYDYLAGCLYKIGREGDALVPQQRAVDLDATYVDARYHLALLLEDLKKYPEATEQMRQVIVRAESEKLNNQLSAKNPILPKAYNEMGALLVGQHIQTVRDLYTAYEMFSTAVSYDPNFRDAQAHLAMVSRMMKAAGLTTQPSTRATTMATTRSIELPADLSAQIQRELSTTRSSTEPTTIPSSGLPAPLSAPAP
jgi:tetratricopeptide (TPR) repeat protein